MRADRSRVRSAVFVPLLAACAADAPRASVARPIVAGELDPGDPAVVALLGDDLCTGTLVAPRVVVTSAHCLGGDSPDSVFLGTDVREEGERLDVVERLAHPRSEERRVGKEGRAWWAPGRCRALGRCRRR